MAVLVLAPGRPAAPRRLESWCRPRGRLDGTGRERGGVRSGTLPGAKPVPGAAAGMGSPGLLLGRGARGSGPRRRVPPGPWRPLAALRR